jgi:membrane-associated phospholipid phosphatase
MRAKKPLELQTVREVASLLIPLDGELLLVPNVTVAEIVPISRVEPRADAPEWYLGDFSWREQTVPLFGDLPPGDYAAGYPGGHALNTIVWYGVLLALVTALLRVYGREPWPLPVRLAIRIAPVVIVVSVSTFLSFHWLTDGLAGLAFGFMVDRLLAGSRRRLLTPAPLPEHPAVTTPAV